MRKTPLKKRTTRSIKPRSNVDPTRVALAALERIREVLVKSGHQARLGEALSMKELAEQSAALGTELPPSYVAAMRVASKIGDPDVLLSPAEMRAEAERLVGWGGEEAKRYAPFCRSSESVICFDKGAGKRVTTVRYQGELPIVEMQDDGQSNPLAAHFGEWLDMVADAREESVESAAKMPQRLKRLLYELGFRFEYPVVGRLETGDVDAVEELIGKELARTVRGEVDRLFDSSGKASMTLNVDEFTLAVSLRTGIYVFEAEDVFRWLRYFRDENFFGDAVREPSHPDQVRDLRRAPREPPMVLRGVMNAQVLPAQNHVFRAASGASKDDFFLLARTALGRSSSMLVHVVDGVIATQRVIDEPLNDLFVAQDGTMWGLGPAHAVRLSGARPVSYPLQRPTPGRAWWYGIGGIGERVLVWGAGALLELDEARGGFVPFEPDAMLDESESVVAAATHGLRVSMLVCGDRMGAVARFDSVQWQAITEDQVIEGSLADLDVWRGAAYVLDRTGNVWKTDAHGPPRQVPLPSRDQAFLTEAGTPRPFHSVRAYDGGMLLASDGGVVAVGASDPVFHAIPGGRDPVRLVRIGTTNAAGAPESEAAARSMGIIALSGGNAWIWRKGGFTVLDMREL